MSRLDSMVKSLSSVGLYSLKEGSFVKSELASYAAGLDILREELETMLRECFFSTAESYGLSRRERLWGKVREELSTQKRREMLTLRNSFGFEDFTPLGIGKVLGFLGVTGTFQEYPSLSRIVIDLSDKDYSQGERNFLLSQIRAVLPAHLETDIVFEGLDWSIIEEKARSFSQVEEKGFTWAQIDLMKI